MNVNQDPEWISAWLDWADTCSVDRCQEKHKSRLKKFAQAKFSRFYAWYASKGYSSKLPDNICAFHELESHLYARQTIKGKPFKSYLFEDIALRQGGIAKNISGYLLGSQSVMKDIVKRSVDIRISVKDGQILDAIHGDEEAAEPETMEEWKSVLLDNGVTSSEFLRKDLARDDVPKTTSISDLPESEEEIDIEDEFVPDGEDSPDGSSDLLPLTGAVPESKQKETVQLDGAQKLIPALKGVWESLPDHTKVLFFCYLKEYPLYIPEVVQRTKAARATASYRLSVVLKSFKQVGDEQLTIGYSSEDIQSLLPACLMRIALAWASKNKACREIVKNVRKKYQTT